MTDFAGIACPGPESLLGAVLAASPMPDMGIKQSNGAGIGEYPASFGAVADNDMGAQSAEDHSGVKVPTYGDMFYYRVHFAPLTISFGQIFYQQTVEIIVFNGFFAPKTLSGINLCSDEGITLSNGLSYDPPITISPIGEIHYSLLVEMSGPEIIDCIITWDFDDIDNVEMVISGERVLGWSLPWQGGDISPKGVLWPLPFKRDMKETLEWKTDILTGDNGREQRIILRSSPRQTYRITSRVPNSYRAVIDNMLYKCRDIPWGFPVWSESTKLKSEIEIGDSIINIDTQYADYVIRGWVLIYENIDKMFIGTIADISDTWIEIEESFNISFATSAVAMPVKSSILKNNPEQSSKGGRNPEISATFLLTDLTTVEESIPAETYNDIDVEIERPVLSEGAVNDVWERDMTVYDFGPGVRRELSTWDYTRKGRAYTRLLRSRSDIWSARQWLMRRRGKAVPFYQPTYQADFILTDLAGNIGDEIICYGNSHPTMGVDRVNIAFFMSDGSVLFRTVTESDENTDGTMTLYLDSSIELARTDIKHISYMGCKRMASDIIEITWKRTDLAELDYSITEIRP